MPEATTDEADDAPPDDGLAPTDNAEPEHDPDVELTWPGDSSAERDEPVLTLGRLLFTFDRLGRPMQTVIVIGVQREAAREGAAVLDPTPRDR